MLAEFARAIVNPASQLWDAIVLMHRWVLHRAIRTCGFAMGYLCSYVEGATGNDSDSDSDSDDVVLRYSRPTQYHECEATNYVDASAKSTEAIDIRNIQDAYVEEDNNALTMSIRKKRDEILSVS
eukprot:927248-Amphidinium_carterae.1